MPSCPSIDKPWKRLWKEDLVPYRELHRDLPFVMVAHAAYPQVTGDNTPASLSKKWMSGILRKKIGYRGLIITDDLDMGGVLAAASIEDAAVETLRAGADMFLVCQKEESVRRAFEAVLKRAESDKKFAQAGRREGGAGAGRRRRNAKALKKACPRRPTQKTVERLTRKIWEFSEELRARLASTRRGGRVIVAGVMSGTSADGINVALVRIQGRGFRSRLELLAHYQFPYPAEVRRTILAAMNAASASVADLSRLNFLLGELYADAVRAAQRRRAPGVRTGRLSRPDASITRATRKPSSAARIACTWQTGEAAIIAAKVGVPVVSDFRPADMAAGGKGAPLVPFLDYVLYRHRRYGRIVQNLGGIGNLTAIPPRAEPEQVIAFDTGPGNMVIDAVTERLFGKPYDRNGRLAARGEPIERVLRELLRNPFFRQKPPKTAGREQFGREFVRDFLRLCRRADETRHRRDRNRADRAIHRHARFASLCCRWPNAPDAIPRVRRLRRRNEECDADANDPRRAGAAEDARAHQRRIRHAFGGERSGGLRAARVSDVAAICPRTFRPPPARSGRRSSARSAMRRVLVNHRDTETQRQRTRPEEALSYFRAQRGILASHNLCVQICFFSVSLCLCGYRFRRVFAASPTPTRWS